MLTALPRIVRDDQLLNRPRERGLDPDWMLVGTKCVLRSERAARWAVDGGGKGVEQKVVECCGDTKGDDL